MARKRQRRTKKAAASSKPSQEALMNMESLVPDDSEDLERSIGQAFSSLRDLVNFETSQRSNNNNTKEDELVEAPDSSKQQSVDEEHHISSQKDSRVKDPIPPTGEQVLESFQDLLNIKIKEEREDNGIHYIADIPEILNVSLAKNATLQKTCCDDQVDPMEVVASQTSIRLMPPEVAEDLRNIRFTDLMCDNIRHSGTVEMDLPPDILMQEGDMNGVPYEETITGQFDIKVEDIAQNYCSLREIARVYQAMGTDIGKKVQRRRGLKRTVCDQCGYRSKTPGDLQKHRRYKHGTPKFKCPIQGCTFQTKYPNNIKHHLPIHNDVRPFQCPNCSWAFKRKNQLNTHMKTHSDDKPHACDQCDFRAKRRWVLTMHVGTVHSEERPFQCDLCGFRMKTRSDMNKHKATHSKVKKWPCPVCSKSFTLASSLYKHNKYMHGEQNPVTCALCKKKFKNKYALGRHLMLHEDDKRFLCEVCSHRFSTKSNLEKHMVVHDETDRPFECPICPFRGKEELHVRSHIGNMHGHMRLYICHICHVRFKDVSKLKQHILTEKHRRNMRFTLPPNDSEVKPSVDGDGTVQLWSVPHTNLSEPLLTVSREETEPENPGIAVEGIKKEPVNDDEYVTNNAIINQDSHMEPNYVKEEIISNATDVPLMKSEPVEPF